MKHLLLVFLSLMILSCSNQRDKIIHLRNALDIARIEIVSIPLTRIDSLLKSTSPDLLNVVDTKNDSSVRSQLIDTDSDGKPDELAFLVSMGPNDERDFKLEIMSTPQKDTSSIRTYSRFVPERIDDYAWENDRVAFRTYGPEAQRLVEDGEKGGTLSSGLDCWLKRVHYSVIDKWYKKPANGGTYHKDDGEGYDPYHVGASRGCGGVGVWKNDSLYVSKNFISYKLITAGPIRSIFELTYAPWQADGITLQETKRITIDLGNQLYKVQDRLQSSDTLPDLTIGITLHEQKGITQVDSINGWFSYWEPIDDSEIGTGVVIDPVYFKHYQDYRTPKKDLSQLHILTKPNHNTVVFYTGFGWSKAGVITSSIQWNMYLNQFSKRLASPLEISFK